MSTRAKFTCSSVEITEYTTKVTMRPVIGGSKENEEFFKTTPNGLIELNIKNEEVIKMFTPGKTYYIDVTPEVEQ